jgi:hypothetical protein
MAFVVRDIYRVAFTGFKDLHLQGVLNYRTNGKGRREFSPKYLAKKHKLPGYISKLFSGMLNHWVDLVEGSELCDTEKSRLVTCAHRFGSRRLVYRCKSKLCIWCRACTILKLWSYTLPEYVRVSYITRPVDSLRLHIPKDTLLHIKKTSCVTTNVGAAAVRKLLLVRPSPEFIMGTHDVRSAILDFYGLPLDYLSEPAEVIVAHMAESRHVRVFGIAKSVSAARRVRPPVNMLVRPLTEYIYDVSERTYENDSEEVEGW